MPDSPSAQLLNILQQTIKARNQNTASLSQLTKMPRKQIKRILSGQEPLTVDALAILANALEINAESLHRFGIEPPTKTKKSANLKLATPKENYTEENWTPDPYGNHHEQLMRMGFALGINFWLVMDTKKIQNSGVPKYVLEKHSPMLRIQLEAQYHPYIEPKYSQHSISLRLSFDALYTCEFPWEGIVQIIFIPPVQEPPQEQSQPPKRPTLRVIK